MFRQVKAELFDEDEDEALAPVVRSALEQVSREYADHMGYRIDWTAVAQLDDATLVNAIAQIAPFDVASKQALLEASSLADRAEQAMQLMQFYTRTDKDNPGVLQ